MAHTGPPARQEYPEDAQYRARKLDAIVFFCNEIRLHEKYARQYPTFVAVRVPVVTWALGLCSEARTGALSEVCQRLIRAVILAQAVRLAYTEPCMHARQRRRRPPAKSPEDMHERRQKQHAHQCRVH